jgi:arylsulfatase A-like enzyme
MSMYGYHKDLTPTLGSFAEEATVFDWAVAPAAWTVPSHASMFTGLYPTVHQTTQSYSSLPEELPTLAELLSKNGYETVGFCNNPLVSLLDHGMKRGFNHFYNYSGTFPDVPTIGPDTPFLKKAHHLLTENLQKLSNPIERRVSATPLLLKLAIMPLFVPFWTRLGKFKGDTMKSLTDVVDFLSYHRSTFPEKPLFTFINMMETHLPYYPPPQVLDKWVPYLRKDRQARDFLQKFNVQTYRWVAPMVEPFSDLEKQVLNDVYDAEVAHQDRQLQRVFRYLKRSGQLEDTMVVIVSDHGESLGEHEFMGHGFGIYNDTVRVPLMIRFPEMFPANTRIPHEVSTRRLFHTILEAAGIEHEAYGQKVGDLSLTRSVGGRTNEAEHEIVISEGYPPMNFMTVVAMQHPDAIDRFRIKQTRRTIFDSGRKLIRVGETSESFFDVSQDYFETNNLLDNPFGYENDVIRLERGLDEFVLLAEARRDGTAAGKQIDYSSNPELLERLRALGYLE